MIRPAAALLCLTLAGCIRAPAPVSSKGETPMATEGKTVTLEGRAENAKAGAILLRDGNDDPVYIEGLDSWPSAVTRKRVRATGVLRSKKMIPDPGMGPEKTAGAFGDQTVLENAKWEPL